MFRGSMGHKAFLPGAVAMLVGLSGIAFAAQDKYTVRVPGGLAFSEFKGYESWQAISISQNGAVVALIVGNPQMIEAYRSGIPANGKPFPDGAKMAKIHWKPHTKADYPGGPTVPDTLANVDFMVKDAKRFADSGGWGYGAFEYEASSGTFRPGSTQDYPPQGSDAKCGLACHTTVKARDYVFTDYAPR